MGDHQRRAGGGLNPDDKIFPPRFEPSKITGWTLEHHLDNQAAGLILEKKGASGWINGDRPPFQPVSGKTSPGRLIILPGSTVIAIETERRLKTRARYQSIIASHLLARTRKLLDSFFMLCLTHRKSGRLNSYLTASDMSSSTISTSRWKNATVGCFAFIPFDELKAPVIGQLYVSFYSGHRDGLTGWR